MDDSLVGVWGALNPSESKMFTKTLRIRTPIELDDLVDEADEDDTAEEEVVEEPVIDPFPAVGARHSWFNKYTLFARSDFRVRCLENACALYEEFPYDEDLKIALWQSHVLL